MTQGNSEKMKVLQTGVGSAVDLAIIGSGALKAIIETFVIICSRRPRNCKTGHFTMKNSRAKRGKLLFFTFTYESL